MAESVSSKEAKAMRLGKRYKQLIDQWVSEILQKYPQVKV
jgi:hypothetical protein